MKRLVQEDIFQSLKEDHAPGWFSGALSALNISEQPGWPDQFGEALRQWNQANTRPAIRTLSLFSGGGGLDLGFHDAGFHIVESVEIEPAFAKTLDINAKDNGRLAGAKVVCGDIHHYHPALRDIEFVIGGPPCQAFSAAGARAAGVNGTDDDRGNLFLQYARILEQLHPKGFLFENVYRIVGAQSGAAWEQVQAAFEKRGYQLFWRILDAADYGVPQFRERLIIVGLRAGEFRFPFPSHGPDSQDEREYYCAGQAVADIEQACHGQGIGGRHGYLLNDIPPGLNYSFYTERMGHPNPIFAWRSKFSDYLYKADPETPVRTIKAQGGQYTGPFSWKNRPFTLEELKRLQTFPDNYDMHGNRQAVIHQLGNSVPPQFARILALGILDQVFKVKTPFHIGYMDSGHPLGFRARKAALTETYASKAKQAIAKLAPGSRESKLAIPQAGSEYFSVEPNLSVRENLSARDSAYFAAYEINTDSLLIHVSQAGGVSPGQKYRIEVDARGLPANAFKLKIALSSSSEQLYSLLSVWKFLEVVLRRHFCKDDLVQLFGYYQYRNQFSYRMQLIDPKLQQSGVWRFVKGVTEGLGVGSIVELDSLRREYGLTLGELTGFLADLKEIGYEIRNSNTNKQIKEGMVLIPYSFPTLNERSLQRLTRL
jgi:DNA (cytosine-5)-methyltransferase 1